MANLEESTISLPIELIKGSCGLGLDIGGSLLKIAYRDKRYFKKGLPLSNKEDDCIQLAKFPVYEVEDNLRFIKENVDLIRNEDGKATVFCTGVNGPLYLKKMKEEGIILQVVYETPCFVETFKVLSCHLKREDFIHPIPEKAVEKGKEVRELLHQWMYETKPRLGNIVLNNHMGVRREKEVNKLPCVVAIAGSAFIYIKINENGSYSEVDKIYPGGATFLGMAKEMTKVKDFDEMIELMSKTDGRGVDLYAAELPPPGDEYPIYTWSKYCIDMNIFPFAKSPEVKEGPKYHGDILSSLFNMFCTNLAHIARLNAKCANVKDVYFCGNFVNSDIAKFNIIRALHTHALHGFNLEEEEEEYHFPKQSGLYGAIGAFIHK